MALDGPPQAAPNATAEHEEAGGDFDAALAAAMEDDAAEGTSVETELAPEPNAPRPKAGKTADAAEGEPGEGEEPDLAAKPEDKPPEPKKDEAKPEDEDGIKLRSGFRALARDRAKLREREATAAAKEQAAGAHVQKSQLLDVVIQRLRTEPIGVIRELGGDELVNKLLDGVIESEKSPAEREVAKLKAELARDKAALAEREQLQQIENWKAGVRQAVSGAGEAYDLVNSLGQQDAVIQVITDYFAKYQGAVLSVEDAAAAVEQTLAKGLEKSKKFGPRAPVNSATPGKGTPAPPARKGGSVTLGSVHSSELPAGADDDLPLDDPAERFKRVMATLS